MSTFSSIRAFLVAAAVSGVLCLLVAVSVQQALRQGANDPQIQLAEDIAAALGRGAAPTGVVPPGTIDAKTSLATFAEVFDASGKALTANVQIDGKTPPPPAGVLASVAARGEDRVTWQTPGGERFAAVVAPYASPSGSGTVLVARSLREVEARESKTMRFAALAWAACLLAAGVGFFARRSKKS